MKPFEENQLGRMQLSNRIGVPAMCTCMAKQDGIATLHHVAHYETLAKGLPAFIIQEATAVAQEGLVDDCCLGIFTPRQRQPLQSIVDTVHDYGVKFGIQLNHAGMKSKSRYPRVGAMQQEGVHALTSEELRHIVVNFEFAGKWAKEMGYDFVEVDAGHGYLIHQFLSPLTNQRMDIYGEDRTLLLKEILTGIKSTFEGDVIVRICAKGYEANGQHVEDMRDRISAINGCQATAISVSGKAINKNTTDIPMRWLPYVKEIKQMTSLPVMGMGGITKESEIEELLDKEACDYVLLGRKLLRDPYALLKWKERKGILREDEVGKCMYRALHSDI